MIIGLRRGPKTCERCKRLQYGQPGWNEATQPGNCCLCRPEKPQGEVVSKDPVCIRKNKHCTEGFCEICNPGIKTVPINEGSAGLALVVFLFIFLIAIALWFQS